MKKSMIIRLTVALVIITVAVCSVVAALTLSSSADGDNIFGGTKKQTFEKTEAVERLMNCSKYYVVVKMKQMGGSHYAYTEAVAENAAGLDLYNEYNFDTGSELVILSVLDNGDGTVSTYEKTVLKVTAGVVRDPCVSADGTKILYSKKTNGTDDYHIYEMDLNEPTGKASPAYAEKKLTFGSGRADIEPQYLPNGDIIFNSTRDVQTVDCWYTQVTNLFVMGGDGSNIRRVGYDQVHTTFPTVTGDGRVLYTRWDYNDRTQMYVQGVFQMFPDGSGQTEVWGNDADFPTTLLHTREIPGAPGKYISIGSGHHVQQMGKLAIIDTSAGRNAEDAIRFLFPDANTAVKYHTDHFGQTGRMYKYPYAIDEDTVLVSAVNSYTGKNAAYSIYLCDKNKSFDDAIELCAGTTKLPAAQIVPLKMSDKFDRVSTIDYAQSTGVYYVANVYAGESMQGVEPGVVKYLRVVGLEFRSSAVGATTSSGGTLGGTADIFSPIAVGNGAWDVKNVLGIVPVEEDGSALFTVPSETPVYFQLLDENGCMIQTMRSWSTLMPGETFSCVGCHESKNSTPRSGGGVTLAMKKGVQTLQKDLWMETCAQYDGYDPYGKNHIGFDYNDVIQPILDGSCVVCHSDKSAAYASIRAGSAGTDTAVEELAYIIPAQSLWTYSVDGRTERQAYSPFGSPVPGQTDVNARWTSGTLTLTKNFVFTKFDSEVGKTALELRYSGNITVKVNGSTVFTGASDALTAQTVSLTKEQTDAFALGQNTLTVTVSGGTYYVECALKNNDGSSMQTLVQKKSEWAYLSSTANNAPSDWNSEDFDSSSWKTGKAPFGDRGDITPMNSSWPNAYIWLRQEFYLTAEQVAAFNNGSASLNIFYDDHLKLYVNGKLIYSDDGWKDSYALIDIGAKPQTFLKEGRNVVAASLYNSGGGRAFDMALRVSPPAQESVSTTAQISLGGQQFYTDNNRLRRSFPLSYYVLTSAYPDGSNWKGNASGKYVKWISTMSGAEMLAPYYSGSSASALITRLRSGHGGLTDAEIRAIECWIDLAVPCWGSYDGGERFSANEMRAYEERVNKRNFYDTWDAYSKMTLGGILPDGHIEATFNSNGAATVVTESGEGWVLLNVPVRYGAGDTLNIKVTGSSYVAVSMNERQGESILYVPSGSLTLTLPPSANETYCSAMMRGSGSSSYMYNTILIRIPTEKELKSERNLAANTYADCFSAGVYPLAAGESVGGAVNAVRNAVDGFTPNGGTGGWPYQSYAPAAGAEMSIDFGREVVVDKLEIKLRQAGGDTHPLSAVVTFDSGDTLTVALNSSGLTLSADLGGRTVTGLTIGSFDLADSGGEFGITEVRVLGHDL